MSALDSISAIGGDISGLVGGNLGRQAIGRLAGQARDATNPLSQPQRQPFQQALMQLLFGGGAKDFLQTDPLIQAEKGQIGDWAKANFASSGNLPFTGIMGSSQLATAFGSQLQQRIQDLLMGGGYTMNNNAGGQGFVSAIGPTMQSYNQGSNQAGDMFSRGINMFAGSGGGGDMSSAWPMPV